jgi:hypothetical protein
VGRRHLEVLVFLLAECLLGLWGWYLCWPFGTSERGGGVEKQATLKTRRCLRPHCVLKELPDACCPVLAACVVFTEFVTLVASPHRDP